MMVIMPDRKLYILVTLITYMILGPLAPWAPGGRTCRPPLGVVPALNDKLLVTFRLAYY